ncbi:MAG: hypothetical protein M3032_01990 [Verrucomicrobiota bacterium]|nr:hypothetical protein [Verrucomicrobiota bacterium]
MKISRLSSLAFLVTSFVCAAPPSDSYTQALWVFPDTTHANPVTDATARQTLVANSAASYVNALYVSVYAYPENSAGRRMYNEAAISDLITRAHAKGISVHAAYGAPDWPSLGCDASGFPQQRMQEVVAYNAAHPTAKFDGVVLDVEPLEPQSEADFQALLAQYDCIRGTLASAGMKLSAAIRFFWDTTLEYPAGSGITKKVYEHIIGMDLRNVVVMGYRDFAGPMDCSTNGIVCLDKDEIAYANSIGKSAMVLAGAETSDPATTTAISNRETFFEEGQSAMNAAAAAVFYAFNGRFGGFAVHNYQNAYLSGVNTKWPTRNGSMGGK